VWRKLQGLGLFIECGINENVSIKVGAANVISCIFPEEEIRDNIIVKEMREIIIPCKANKLLCISGKILRITLYVSVQYRP